MAKLTVPSYVQGVQQQGLPGVRAQTEGDALGLGQVVKGLQQLGQGAQQVAEVAAHARDQADATLAVEAETQLQAEATDGLTHREHGLLNLRGKAAADASGTLYERLEKRRGELAEKYLKNDRQRAVFSKRAAGIMDGVRSRTETHVAQETQRAAVSAAEGRAAIALDAIANDYKNPDTILAETEAAETAIRALGTASPEEAAARVQQLHANVTKTVLGQYLARGDGAGAREFFKANRKLLGDESAPLERAVEEAERTQRADRTAGEVVKGALVGEGYAWVSREKALAGVEALQVPTPEKDEVRQRVLAQVGQLEQAKREAGDQHLQAILAIREQTGNAYHPSIAQHRAWLLDPKNGNADLWAKYRNDVERDARERVHAGASTRREAAEARRAQAETDKLLLERLDAMGPEERAQVNPETYGLGELSAWGREATKKRVRVAGETVRKGDTSGEGEFYRTLEQEAVRGGIDPKDREGLTRFKAHLGQWRQRYVQDHQGKAPTRREVDEELATYRRTYDRGLFRRDKTGAQIIGMGQAIPAGAAESEAPAARPAAGPARAAVAGVELGQDAAPVTSAAAIPEGARSRLVEQYAAKHGTGKTPSEAELVNAYNTLLRLRPK